ncbi:MAG TPA: hypothetical protein PKI20_19790 [Verrucomicrobiota bacterium]|nr:hypothetical protein [Verrucomicrobiota bacterium]
MKHHHEEKMTAKSVFGIITITLSLAICVHAQTWLTNGLVAYYPFNGNANDASGNGHNANVNSNTALTIDRFGNANAACHFQDAIMQFTNIPLNVAGPFSFGMWMRLNTYDEGYAIAELNDTNFYCNANPVIHQGSGNVTLTHCGGSGGEGGSSPLSFGPASGFLNAWHHLFVSVAGGGQTTVYRDGQIITNKLTMFPITTFANLTLGDAGNLSAGYQNSNVDLDDVRIYNRALFASEVQQLYEHESGPRVNFVKAFTVDASNLSVGSNYILQASSDLTNWTIIDDGITSSTGTYTNTTYWRVDDWNKLFFRLKTTP